jgi:hypothetical protein
MAIDTEWNVEVTQRGPATSAIQGKSDTLTIVQDTGIHVLQILPFMQPEKFPPLLTTKECNEYTLANTNIRECGQIDTRIRIRF